VTERQEPKRERFVRARKNPKALEKKARGVSAGMDFAAYMDALGLPTKEIAEICAVHIKTVSHWRGTQDYMERVTYWRSREIEKLDPIINRLKIDAAHMVDVAIKTLIDTMQNADLADGRPNYGMRASAAKEALTSSIARLAIGADAAAGVSTQINQSQQTVTLVFNEGAELPEDSIDTAEFDEITDIEEVEEVADVDSVALEIEDDTEEGDTGGEEEAAEDHQLG
jgi:hypothetical protein